MGDYVRKSDVDRMVRARVAEIMSAAGVDHGRVGVEVLYKLPPEFTMVYEWLYDLATMGFEGARGTRGLRDDGELGRAKDSQMRPRVRENDESDGRMRVASGGSARRGLRGSGRGSRGGMVGEEEARAIKERVDKQLRGISRRLFSELAGLGMGVDQDSGEVMVRPIDRAM